MIQFRNVSKRYGKKTILDNLTLDIKAGEFVILIGPSGCGKTTTLKTINRLIEPDSGEIIIDGKDITKVDPVKLRRTIGYVIQQIGLFPNMTVEQNIAVVPKLLNYSKEEIDAIVHRLLELVNMPYEENAKKYPSELSGGQQQRIGVLRALAASPPIVLMDEPFGALDPVTRDSLQEEVKKIQKKLGKTIVFVTHDMDEAIRLADTIVFMNDGKVLQVASPEEMLQNPADPIIKSFLGKHMNHENNAANLVASDFMRAKVLTVPKTKKTLECIELMSRRDVSSLIVVEEDDTYLGTVSVDKIRAQGKAGKEIKELVTVESMTVTRNSNAQEAFELLIASPTGYVVVLNDDNTVAGLITKTSMAKAMGEALWGEMTQ
ncbi:choline transport ATP-binding protein OpuBA [Anaerotignum neopropionicum]|uniref:Quaternary amine transport ATP-binding protein n=1 Tax=Anaerotignum neopropionicum TaxID=36847 RepID=A0A136WIU6_9FIRM|nr:betaine/proline/choline family ABC transporter ATP-binding protein [Anaerotignum neopropionicum]KXL54238.1 choline transport ATP-binding protein OpuBA [Anaerotignum neopropionicum]KXL54363.1 choline transport ATP-binding protein OpuBA [Anaerotignum neopropionicum]